MPSHSRERKIIEPYPSRSPEIGRWLWALEETRRDLLGELRELPPAALDWQPAEGESTIGTILYHIALIEADWLYVEVLEAPFPPEIVALFPHETRDAEGRLVPVRGLSLDDHLARLDRVRARLLDAFQHMALDDFRRARALEHYDVTPEWVLYHLMQHEAEHRGQIAALRARAADG